MDLLRMPRAALAVKSSAREITQKRLKNVHSFFKKWSASQALRRASLILQLTGGVEGFVSAEPKEGAPPTVAAILQGQAHAIVNERLQRLLGAMHHDPDLDLAAATGALLATGVDLILRLNEYKKFPYKFCTMCRKWFPVSHRASITRFLQAPAEDLDVGFSLPFQRLALSQGGELLCRAWVLSDAVQEFLEEAAIALFAHSLAAERKAAQVKRREARHISLLANVSRDLLCTQFTKQQATQAKIIEAASERLRKLRRSGWSAIGRPQHQ